MENFNKKVKEVTNKNGKVIEKITTIQPKDKKGRISLESVDKLYKKLHVKSKDEGKKFMIKIMTLDGMKTLKTFDYDEDSEPSWKKKSDSEDSSDSFRKPVDFGIDKETSIKFS